MPWPQKTGKSFAFGRASRATLSGMGIHVDSATYPARLRFLSSSDSAAMAPPCEKPPSTILSSGMPLSTSSWISASILSTVACSPASSSSPSTRFDRSSVLMSNQPSLSALRVVGLPPEASAHPALPFRRSA